MLEEEDEEQMSDLTLEGRLVITEVQYEDGVEITCIATHSISGAEESLTVRFRVRGTTSLRDSLFFFDWHSDANHTKISLF